MTHLKGYMKAVKAELEKTNPERVDAFEKGAAAYAKKIFARLKDFEFYTGESMNADGMAILLNYRVCQVCVPALIRETDHIFPLTRRTESLVCTSLLALNGCDTDFRSQLT